MFIVHLAGHLGKDPETRFTPSGQKVTTFTMAINQRKGKEDVTMWVRVSVWGDRFDKILSYLKKGSGVVVVGRMNIPSSYTDKEGRTQISLEVTAEMIEFSPFGRTDRAGEGQFQQGGAQSYKGQSSYEPNASTPYQESSYQSQTPSYQYNPSHSNYGSQAPGQGSQPFSAVNDEDDLPF